MFISDECPMSLAVHQISSTNLVLITTSTPTNKVLQQPFHLKFSQLTLQSHSQHRRRVSKNSAIFIFYFQMPRINSAIFQKIDARIWTISTYESFLNVKKFKTILSYGYIIIFQIYSGRCVYIFSNTQSVFCSAKPVPSCKNGILTAFYCC